MPLTGSFDLAVGNLKDGLDAKESCAGGGCHASVQDGLFPSIVKCSLAGMAKSNRAKKIRFKHMYEWKGFVNKKSRWSIKRIKRKDFVVSLLKDKSIPLVVNSQEYVHVICLTLSHLLSFCSIPARLISCNSSTCYGE